ncbi:MAG: hypothetical protein ACOC07_08670 [Coleofasciculus sp.]|uniref:hypothetical protein n=1 Tax=Coleofasciculus sp. TaxID=3100458 RepID=UPI003A3E52E4
MNNLITKIAWVSTSLTCGLSVINAAPALSAIVKTEFQLSINQYDYGVYDGEVIYDESFLINDPGASLPFDCLSPQRGLLSLKFNFIDKFGNPKTYTELDDSRGNPCIAVGLRGFKNAPRPFGLSYLVGTDIVVAPHTPEDFAFQFYTFGSTITAFALVNRLDPFYEVDGPFMGGYEFSLPSPVSSPSTPVPEPSSLLASVLALGFGILFSVTRSSEKIRKFFT